MVQKRSEGRAEGGSVAGLRGVGTQFAYAASKWAVRGMSRSAAVELAPHDIRVNSVHPGIIETPIWETVVPGSLRPDGQPLDLAAWAENIVPTGVLGQPTDIANGVLFLASDDSSYITGTELVIDAGVSA